MREEHVAIFVDGAFFQRRARTLWGKMSANDLAERLHKYCIGHLSHTVSGIKMYDSLYRIFYYDCPPLINNVFHPLKKQTVSLAKTDLYAYTHDFHNALLKKRKVALRLGRLSNNDLHYMLTYDAQKRILSGSKTVDDLTDEDFALNVRQKGVDMRIGLDISSLAYKKQVTRMILISGDSDFVPAAKLARREGIDFLLDPMGASISTDLMEHIDGLQTQIRQAEK